MGEAQDEKARENTDTCSFPATNRGPRGMLPISHSTGTMAPQGLPYTGLDMGQSSEGLLDQVLGLENTPNPLQFAAAPSKGQRWGWK